MQAIDLSRSIILLSEAIGRGDVQKNIEFFLKSTSRKERRSRTSFLFEALDNLMENLDFIKQNPALSDLAGDMGLLEQFNKGVIEKIKKWHLTSEKDYERLRINDTYGQWSIDRWTSRNYWECIYLIRSTVIALNKFADTHFKNIILSKFSTINHGEELLSFIIPDNNNGFNIESISQIYANLASFIDAFSMVTYGNSNQLPKIIYFDSGSNATFGIKFDGKFINALRNLIIEIWSKFRQSKTERHRGVISSLDEEISILVKINKLVESGKLDTETGNRLKVQIRRSSEKLICSGLIINPDEKQITSVLENHQQNKSLLE